MSEETNQRLIRDPKFAARLEKACEGHPHVPPYNKGRHVWIKDQLQQRFGMSVSMETVRKWFAGESRPRPDKMKYLATLLEVDEAWLSLGVQPELAPRERKARNAMADGAVNVVAGFIQMGGGHPAFPQGDDKRAVDQHIDLYAVIKGAQYAFHVATAQPEEGGEIRFTVPSRLEGIFVIGLIQTGATSCELIEIPSELAELHGERRGGSIELAIRKSQNRYFLAPDAEAPVIRGFDRRI